MADLTYGIRINTQQSVGELNKLKSSLDEIGKGAQKSVTSLVSLGKTSGFDKLVAEADKYERELEKIKAKINSVKTNWDIAKEAGNVSAQKKIGLNIEKLKTDEYAIVASAKRIQAEINRINQATTYKMKPIKLQIDVPNQEVNKELNALQTRFSGLQVELGKVSAEYKTFLTGGKITPEGIVNFANKLEAVQAKIHETIVDYNRLRSEVTKKGLNVVVPSLTGKSINSQMSGLMNAKTAEEGVQHLDSMFKQMNTTLEKTRSNFVNIKKVGDMTDLYGQVGKSVMTVTQQQAKAQQTAIALTTAFNKEKQEVKSVSASINDAINQTRTMIAMDDKAKNEAIALAEALKKQKAEQLELNKAQKAQDKVDKSIARNQAKVDAQALKAKAQAEKNASSEAIRNTKAEVDRIALLQQQADQTEGRRARKQAQDLVRIQVEKARQMIDSTRNQVNNQNILIKEQAKVEAAAAKMKQPSLLANVAGTALAGVGKVMTGIASAFNTVTSLIGRMMILFYSLNALVQPFWNAFMDYSIALVNMGKVSTDKTKTNASQIQAYAKSVKSLNTQLGSETELLKAVYQVQSAGVGMLMKSATAEQERAKALEITVATTKAAKVAHIEQGQVVKGVTALMFAYRDSMTSATQATDLLFKMEALAKTEFQELIPVIGTTANMSAKAGINFREMGGAMSLLTQYTGSTAEAATQMEAVITAMINPTVDMVRLMKQFGGVGEAIKRFGLVGTLELIQKATGGMNERLTQLIGRKEGIQGFMALSQNGFRDLNTYIMEMNDSLGYSAQVWDNYANSFEGSWNKLKASASNFFKEVFSGNEAEMSQSFRLLSARLDDSKNQMSGWGSFFIFTIGSVAKAINTLFGLTAIGVFNETNLLRLQKIGIQNQMTNASSLEMQEKFLEEIAVIDEKIVLLDKEKTKNYSKAIEYEIELAKQKKLSADAELIKINYQKQEISAQEKIKSLQDDISKNILNGVKESDPRIGKMIQEMERLKNIYSYAQITKQIAFSAKMEGQLYSFAELPDALNNVLKKQFDNEPERNKVIQTPMDIAIIPEIVNKDNVVSDVNSMIMGTIAPDIQKRINSNPIEINTKFIIRTPEDLMNMSSDDVYSYLKGFGDSIGDVPTDEFAKSILKIGKAMRDNAKEYDAWKQKVKLASMPGDKRGGTPADFDKAIWADYIKNLNEKSKEEYNFYNKQFEMIDKFESNKMRLLQGRENEQLQLQKEINDKKNAVLINQLDKNKIAYDLAEKALTENYNKEKKAIDDHRNKYVNADNEIKLLTINYNNDMLQAKQTYADADNKINKDISDNWKTAAELIYQENDKYINAMGVMASSTQQYKDKIKTEMEELAFALATPYRNIAWMQEYTKAFAEETEELHACYGKLTEDLIKLADAQARVKADKVASTVIAPPQGSDEAGIVNANKYKKDMEEIIAVKQKTLGDLVVFDKGYQNYQETLWQDELSNLKERNASEIEITIAHFEHLVKLDEERKNAMMKHNEDIMKHSSNLLDVNSALWSTWALNQKSMALQISEAMQTSVTGFTEGLGQAFAQAMVYGEDLSTLMENLFQQILSQLAATLITMIINEIIVAMIGNQIAQSSAMGKISASAGRAAAGAMASVFESTPYPASLAAAPAAAASASALTLGIAGGILSAGSAGSAIAGGGNFEQIPAAGGGTFHGGSEYVPKETTYLLDKGERVLSPRQNTDLTSYLKNNKMGSNNNISVGDVSVGLSFAESKNVEDMYNSNPQKFEMVLTKAIRKSVKKGLISGVKTANV